VEVSSDDKEEFPNAANEKGWLSDPIKVIKGNQGSVRYVQNQNDGSSCGSSLSVGDNYVVCVVDSAPLISFMCGYTRYLYEDPSVFMNRFKDHL
jgi:hypothetical protein